MGFAYKRYLTAEKEEILARFEKSRLSVQQFCQRENGPNPITLNSWLREKRFPQSKFAVVRV